MTPEEKIEYETGIKVKLMVIQSGIEEILREKYSSCCMDNEEDRNAVSEWMALFLIQNMEQAVRKTREKYERK